MGHYSVLIRCDAVDESGDVTNGLTIRRAVLFLNVIVSATLNGELPENEMNNKNLDYTT